MAAMKWDYGDPRRGLSYEYTNLFDAMAHTEGVEVRLFDFMEAHLRGGPLTVTHELREAVAAFDPDLLFVVLFTDQIPAETLAELRDRPRPITFNWFCDDHWRFEDFTARWAPLFNACSTTATSALPKYARIGYTNVLKTQWACNHHLYRRTEGPLRHEVTFVGQPHGNRRAIVARLARRGIAVETYGYGWPAGKLDHQEMVTLFGTSRINLNLSNASTRSLLGQLRGRSQADQIKGRNFEIPGCGGFQLSGTADDIEAYFEPDQEIVLFSSLGELQEAIGRYQRDEKARAKIAEAGYRRTLAEHTYAARFAAIFRALDLQPRDPR